MVTLALTGATLGADAVLAQKADGTSPSTTASVERGTYTAPNGDVFSFAKQLGGSEEKVVYTRDGVTYDAEALARYKIENPPPVIEPELLRAAERAGDAPVALVVWLKNRPGSTIARQVQELYAPELDAMAADVQAVQRELRLDMSLSPAEEANYIDFAQRGYLRLTEAQQALIDERKATIDALSAAMQAEIRRQTERAIAPDQRQLARAVDQLGGAVDAVLVSRNAAQITLPGRDVAYLSTLSNVARITEVPIGRLDLDKQDTSLGLNSGFWNDGIDGGVWDAGVLDTGVQQDHPDLDHLTYESTYGTTDSNGHGTGVAGIIASNDSTYRGMAYSLDNMLVGDCLNGNVYDHADWMVGDRQDDPEAINLSCGYGTPSTNDYTSMDKFFDGLVDDHSVLLVKSAGNNGAGTSTMTKPAAAYNVMTVANVDDRNTTSRGDDILRYTSSRGPTLGGRKKPDISAPGHNTHTAHNDWATGSDFVDLGGTSAAAPHVTGGALLVTDLRGNDDPKASKAVLINTADARDSSGSVDGSAWNADFGWGYLNLGEAWLNGTDVFRNSVTDDAVDYKLYLGTMYEDEKATVVWHRHVDSNGTSTPTQIADLSDLDLYAYSASNGALIDSSTSHIDNVEQIAVDSDGDVVLKVELYGSLDSTLSKQTYALATEENFVKVDPPSLSATAIDVSAPSGFPGFFPIQMAVQVTNSGEAPAAATLMTVTAPSGWMAMPVLPFVTIPGGATVTMPVMVFSNCGSAGQSETIDISLTSNAYGETFTAATSGTVNCG
ncbi:MAG: S8 family serine peptidase [Acidobacteriota bacterium]